MITILIITGILFTMALWQIIEDFNFNAITFVFGGLFLIISTGVGLLFGAAVAGLIPYPTTTTIKTSKIECLQDNSSTRESFFLGCGNVDGSMKYVYYVQNEDNSIEMKVVNYDEVILYYREGKPTVEEDIIIGKDNEEINWYSLCATCGDTKGKTRIYIPKGTIQQQYRLDAQ